MRCEICNFSETVPGSSNYYKEEFTDNNTVKYRKKFKQYLCSDCYNAVKLNSLIYSEDNKTGKDLSKNTPTLPLRKKLRRVRVSS